MLDTLKEYGVFIVIVSESLGTVTGENGAKLEVDEIFLTTSPYLLDSLYIVGGNHKDQEMFNYNVNHFLSVAYKHYKPLGIASTGESFITQSGDSNLEGVVFASQNPDFGVEFVSAIAQHRFWDRK